MCLAGEPMYSPLVDLDAADIITYDLPLLHVQPWQQGELLVGLAESGFDGQESIRVCKCDGDSDKDLVRHL